jgi:hypothetical protein
MSNRSSVACALALAVACAVAAASAVSAAPAKTTKTSSASTPRSKAPRVPSSPSSLTPAADTIATVLGQGLTRADLGAPPSGIEQAAKGDSVKAASLTRTWESQAFTGFVLGMLLDRWTQEQNIHATPAEVSEILAVARKGADDPEAKKRGMPVPDTTSANVRMASAAVVTRFKMHSALHKKYGGRVLVDPQAGPLPFDAYKRFLEAEEKEGKFAIRADWKDRFWAAFAATEGKEFVPDAEAAAVINKEWWRE